MSTAPIAQGPVDVNVRGWIDQNDALPNDGQRVLCWEDFTSIGKKWQGVEVFYYRAGIGFVNLPDDDDAYGCIAHWMPLPEAPNAELRGAKPIGEASRSNDVLCAEGGK